MSPQSRSRGPRTPATGHRGLRVGRKLTVTFQAMNREGTAVARYGSRRVAVPYALPGEEALIEVVRAGADPRGKIITLLRKSPQTTTPRCRHFGVCGGCQWQHLPYEAQLAYKTQLVRQDLGRLIGDDVTVHPAAGSPEWEYRSRLQATVALRADRVVAGFYAEAEERRIINVRECPIQHPENVRALTAVRDVIAALDWPVYDHTSRRGLVRGVLAQTAPSSGETMVVLTVTRELPDRMAFVRAMRDRLPSLTSLMLSVQPRRSPEVLGRLSLLWGRDYLEDEIAGIRLRLYPTAAMPPNPRGLRAWLEAIAAGVRPTDSETLFDAACEEGLVPVMLAARAARVIGVAPTRTAMHHAWENARLNGVQNCVFYTRAPEDLLVKLRSRGERIDAAVVTSRGRANAPALFQELTASGARRLVCTGSTLSLLASDLRAARAAGFRIIEVRPIDLLPQTSRIHCVVHLERVQGGSP